MTDLSASDVRRFGAFVLDVRERRLARDGQPVALPSRYFDLLVALTARPASLVDKATLFETVWPGVVVGDAALSQGIRALRVALGDEAAQPRFIETVAGHGYRFIAAVERVDVSAAEEADADPGPVAPARAPAVRMDRAPAEDAIPGHSGLSLAPRSEVLSRSGAVGGALLAALVGGVLYGLALAGGGTGSAQTVVSVTAMSLAVGGLGAASVATGARLLRPRGRVAALVGAGLGGALVGAVGAYAGHSLLVVLTGRDVAVLTGPAEGFVIGLALAAGPLFLRDRTAAVVASAALTLVVFAALSGLAGRPTFIGSLEHTLALPGVPLRLDGLAPGGLTPALRALLSAFEGALFGLGFGAGAVVRRGPPRF